jgi:hypothetical protein
MQRRAAVVSLAVVVLAVAGCGNTGTTATTAATSSAAKPTTTGTGSSQPFKYPPIKTASYSVALSGANGVSGPQGGPPGAPNGSGLATITINASTHKLCWNFSLKNVTEPTVARVYWRQAGRASWRFGFHLGRTYSPSGCTPIPEGAKAVEAEPQEWWLSIHSRPFPGGAVRGQF